MTENYSNNISNASIINHHEPEEAVEEVEEQKEEQSIDFDEKEQEK